MPFLAGDGPLLASTGGNNRVPYILLWHTYVVHGSCQGGSMKSLATAVVIGILGLVATSNPLSAQSVWIGGGGTFPVSDFGRYANTGFEFEAGVGTPVGDQGLGLGVGGFYGQNNHEAIDGDKTNPYGFMGLVEYDFAGRDADRSFYVIGELGVLWHKFSSNTSPETTDSGFMYGGAAGYFFPLGGVSGWVEGQFTQASIDDENTSFFGIVAGISIPLGD